MEVKYILWNDHSNCDCVNSKVIECSFRKIKNESTAKCKKSLAAHVCKHVLIDKNKENWEEISPFLEKYNTKTLLVSTFFASEQSKSKIMNDYEYVGKRIYEQPLFAYRYTSSSEVLCENYLGRVPYLGILTGINSRKEKMSTIFKTYKYGEFGNFLIKSSRIKIGDWIVEPPTIESYKLIETNTLRMAFNSLSFRFCDLLDTLNDVEKFYRKYKDDKEFQNEFVFSTNVLTAMVDVVKEKLEPSYFNQPLLLDVYKNTNFYNVQAKIILGDPENYRLYNEFVETLIETNYEIVKELENKADIEEEVSTIVHHIGIVRLAGLFSKKDKKTLFQNQFIEAVNSEHMTELKIKYGIK